MARQPGIFARAGQSRDERDLAAVFLVRRVVQAAELVTIEKETRLIVRERVGPLETRVFVRRDAACAGI